MKTYLILLAFITVCLVQCRKPATSNSTDITGLPPATQSGANTLGFLLNGVPWVPTGNNGTANLSIDYDPGINNGIFSIAAYRIFINGDTQYFGIGLKDSLNLIQIPSSFQIGNGTNCGVFYSKGNCMYDYFSSDIYRTGNLKISKLDRNNRIIAGEFRFTVYKIGCDSIKITNGRFDIKF
jgi:hypothetical protein